MFMIVWRSPRWGDVFAGRKHDWEENPNTVGVLKFDTEAEAREFMQEYIWEKPVRVIEEK